jgi:oligosaccharide repeat unit polymerase
VGRRLAWAGVALGSVAIGTVLPHDVVSRRALIVAVSVFLFVVFAAFVRTDRMRPWILLGVLWYPAVAISQLHLLTGYEHEWSNRTAALILVGPVLIAVPAAVISRGSSASAHRGTFPSRVSARRLRAGGVVLLGGALVGSVLRAHLLGGITVLSANVDAARAQRVPAPVTFLTDGAFIAFWLFLARLYVLRRTARRISLVDAGLAVASLGVVASVASRNTLLLALGVPLLFAHGTGIMPRVKFRYIAAIVAVTAAILSGLFFYRTSQHRTDAFEHFFYYEIVPATPRPLRPLLPAYLSFATGFETLSRVTAAFPSSYPYGGGRYSLSWIPRQLQVVRRDDLNVVTGQLSQPYYFNVSTYEGPLYADAGWLGVVIGSFLMGIGLGFAERWLLARRTAPRAGVRAFLAYTVAFLLYANLFTLYLSPLYDMLVFGIVLNYAHKPGRRHLAEDLPDPEELGSLPESHDGLAAPAL